MMNLEKESAMKNNKNVYSKILALVGTVLTWFPVAAPFILGLGSLMVAGVFRFDYLMPAELFPSALFGSLLLLWASVREHAHVKLIGWGLAIAVVLLFGGQGLAIVTGLASGETEPTPWLMALILVPTLLYAVAIAAVGVGGILLTRDLFKQKAP